ncbi:beta-glucosidase [Henriciella litoralis]|uniref:beta-glucosidase n=1 Tax=Henriciella litoralis TaxID=568102 RepID=UPI0009FE22CF|nr:glycoside hydrolase family 3 C-terminal domain-containing protein [Henriciella litoralis]
MRNQHSDFNAALDDQLEKELDDIIGQLTLEEKVWMMSGHDFFKYFFGEDNRQFGQRTYQAGSGCERLGIDPLLFSDGPRGVRSKRPTSTFPVSMARGATWDTDLERRIGDVMGIEARAIGVTLSGAICINLLRHPGWGRAQETYGEDPHLLGEMGAALCEGIQAHNVIATVKHYALNSIENSRFRVNVKASERVMREVYLPHFKRVLDAGCASVMSAYNKVNGDYCGHSRHLLRDILKDDWGFKGFVHSDWVKGAYGADAAEAGLDVENPEPIYFGKNLVAAVNEGQVSQWAIDDAVRRILRTQFTFSRAEDDRAYDEEDIACDAHRQLAQEVAEKSFVLLKNDSLLPLDASKSMTIACFGPLMDMENLGDHGSSRTVPPYVVTLLEGLKARAGDPVEIIYDDGTDPAGAKALAAKADACIVAAGFTWEDEGEFIPGNEAMEGLDSEKKMDSRGGDRDQLRLLDRDEDLIDLVCSANPNTLVAIMAGSAVTMESWKHKPAAIMMVWYPGMEGGTAFARVVFGDVSPSGKLPFTIPQDERDLPFFDPNADEIEYGLYHGYTHLAKSGASAAFAFGYGLGYSTFAYGAPRKVVSQGKTCFEAEVTNVGERSSEEVVQFYVGFASSQIDRPAFLLKGFSRVSLSPGETTTVRFDLSQSDLAYFDETRCEWAVEAIDYTAHIGADSVHALEQGVSFGAGEIV